MKIWFGQKVQNFGQLWRIFGQLYKIFGQNLKNFGHFTFHHSPPAPSPPTKLKKPPRSKNSPQTARPKQCPQPT
ncbi:hypothetical protein EKQ44_18880 [Sutcliffiella horikoshii]|nr:hypothetical protein [Sutcliffiella horikoshii]